MWHGTSTAWSRSTKPVAPGSPGNRYTASSVSAGGGTDQAEC